MNAPSTTAKAKKQKRKPELWEAFVPIIGMAILLGGGYGVLQFPVEILLICASIIVVGVMIESWIACGSIPMLIDYGLGIVSPSQHRSILLQQPYMAT